MRSLLKSQVHNYTIRSRNWDHNEFPVMNSLRGDAMTINVYVQTDGQSDNGLLHCHLFSINRSIGCSSS